MKKKNYSDIVVQDGKVIFSGSPIELKDIKEFQIDHRAFICTAVLFMFVLGSIVSLYCFPQIVILVAGCMFIWLKVEFSRYVELKMVFRDGTVKKMLSASIMDRSSIYTLYDSLNDELATFNAAVSEK